MLVDGRDDFVVDKAPNRIPNETLFLGKQIVDTIEIHSSKRHNTPGRRRYHSGVKPDSAIEIIRQLRQKGHEAYLVGGCVRDMVMKIEPSDYDIATSAPPAEIMKIFPHTEPIGAQFGVVLVIHRGHPFEVATFRSDEAYVDGRRPTGVVFTDARTDVLRRDFTINGLLYDPFEETRYRLRFGSGGHSRPDCASDRRSAASVSKKTSFDFFARSDLARDWVTRSNLKRGPRSAAWRRKSSA